MALTLNESITRVRYILNEATAAFWLDAEITAWIQDGSRLFSTRSGLYEVSDTVTLVADQIEYTSSDHAFIGNILQVQSALYNNGSTTYKGLVQIDPKQIGNLLTKNTGVPKYISQHARSIFIWPRPSSTEAGHTVDLLHAAETDDITNLNDEYQGYVIDYAAAMGFRKDRQFAKAAAMMTEFFGNIETEKALKFNRPVDTADSFQIPKGRQR